MAAAVAIGVIAVWLSSRRVEFGWRLGWLAVIFVVVSASTLAGGEHLAGMIATGIFEGARGIGRFLGMLPG